MQQHNYFTYYEGLDKNGAALVNGNGIFSTSPGTATHKDMKLHIDYLVNEAKSINPDVTRVVIKNITRL